MSLHPSQELWNKITWENKGPNVVDTTISSTAMSEDTIVAYFSGNKQERLPPLWKTRGNKILLSDDLKEGAVVVTPTACNNLAVERLEQALLAEVDLNVLPKLVLCAVLEEGLHELVTKQASSSTTGTTTATTTSSFTNNEESTGTSVPPLYYTSPPSAYLHPPVLQDESNTTISGYSPFTLLQRIKAACLLAFHYHTQDQSFQNYNSITNTSDSRRSARLAPPTRPILPNILLKGGRICQFLINQDYQEKEEVEEEAVEEPAVMQQQEDKTTVPPSEPKLDSDGYKEESPTSEDDEEEPDDVKDDDFEPQGSESDDEDESLQVDQDEEMLSVQQEEESSSEEEESDDEDASLDEDDLVFSNPHFAPTLTSILDWMGRRGKSLTTANIQQAILFLLKEGISLPIKERYDCMVIENNGTPAIASSTTTRITLECTSGETIKELSKMETSDFQKCRFRFQVTREAPALLDENQKALEEQYYAELDYKKKKAWATWRYKGIQTGYTAWPQWTDAATAWRREQQVNDGLASTDSAAAMAVQEEEASGVAAVAATNSTESSDLALAQAMDETGGRRRTRRAGGDGGAVFYGGQTGMSHKQLMDTIVRLAYQQPCQTITALTSLVAEESSNPMHRIRVALGKLLWKQNCVTRVRVNSVWTDMPLWNILSNQALLQVPAQFKAEEEPSVKGEDPSGETAVALPLARNLPTEENLKHLKVLTEYIRNLHQTELQLRSLILRHLTTTPILTLATAADERAGSQEAVDAVHFEGDHSSLEWSTEGHDLLNQVIFRPSFLVDSPDTPECTWYKIKDYVPSVPMPPMDEETTRSDGRPRVDVVWKEPLAVERRMRFRAYPVTEEGVDLGEGAILVLTEAQVHAGIMAANLERKKEASAKSAAEHPFAIGAGSNITLQSLDGAVPDKHVQVAGYDTVFRKSSSSDGDLEHRILLLPRASESSDSTLAFWAVANLDENGILTCQPAGSSATFKILQTDCDSSSSAFVECEGIIEFLHRQTHSQIFAEPVDPVALMIPTYFSVIKRPMDISTLSANLEKGVYSKIPPGQNVGRSPVARMLNGPFKDDVVRIFDNAMLFNPPDDWIHHTAAAIKKAVVKKIDQVSREADDRLRAFSPRKKSLYIDDDSDVDMYEYESDRDDEDYGRRTVRKRKRVGGKDDFSTQAMEAPVNLRKMASESLGLSGPFSSLPINSETAGFSLSPEWNCRHRTASPPEEVKEDAEELKRKQEMEELLLLHHQVEEMERAGLRRSSRAHPVSISNGSAMPAPPAHDFEYFLEEGALPLVGDEEADATVRTSAASRSQVESQRETLHEVYFAKLYQQLSKFLQPIDKDYGSYMSSSFPPFLGCVMPSLAPGNAEEVTWELRATYVLPAIRWVLRGLVHSGHLTEVEADVLMTNDIYYADDSQQPFDVLDMKEMQRRRRATAASEEEESEEEVEMSEYEKLRAERVARNAERLKALGLA